MKRNLILVCLLPFCFIACGENEKNISTEKPASASVQPTTVSGDWVTDNPVGDEHGRVHAKMTIHFNTNVLRGILTFTEGPEKVLDEVGRNPIPLAKMYADNTNLSFVIPLFSNDPDDSDNVVMILKLINNKLVGIMKENRVGATTTSEVSFVRSK